MTKDELRFWSKVRIGDGCWEWTKIVRKDYGCFEHWPDGWTGRKVQARAHRYSWELANGPIPAGLVVCHKCDNPICVRPSHLFVGTQADNMADMKAKGRRAPVDGTIRSGSRNWSTRLTEAIVLQVRRRLSAGETCRSLAQEFGVARSTIDTVKHRRSWAWLKDAP